MLRLTLYLLITFIVFPFFTFGQNEVVTIALSDRFSSLDTLSTTYPDLAAERVGQLIYNSLVKKNERFEYVGDLAKDIKIDYERLTITFTLHNEVKFHSSKILTSADAKYTLEALFESNGYKASSFYDSRFLDKPPYSEKTSHILSIETPSRTTLVIKVRRAELINQTLSNLVAIPIIPEGTFEQQKEQPIGTGAFKFVKFDQTDNFVELEANPQYWEGSPKIEKLIVKTVSDPNALIALLQSGKIDIAPNPSGFEAKKLVDIGQLSNLQVVQTNAANIRYLGFNLKAKTTRNLKFRQAVAYAINREKIIADVLDGQARIANSILPEESWAYSAETKYEFNPTKAKKLLREIGYKGQKIVFKISAGNTAVAQYSQAIQTDIKAVGINCEILFFENNSLLEDLKQGNFQLTTSVWIGGNQDPTFLRSLFHSKESPDTKAVGRNRSRYSNPMFDKLIDEAKTATSPAREAELYGKSQELVAGDLPLIPLWNPANIVIANKRFGNIQMSVAGDWSFVRKITLK